MIWSASALRAEISKCLFVLKLFVSNTVRILQFLPLAVYLSNKLSGKMHIERNLTQLILPVAKPGAAYFSAVIADEKQVLL